MRTSSRDRIRKILTQDSVEGRSYAQLFYDFLIEACRKTNELTNTRTYDGTTRANVMWMNVLDQLKGLAFIDPNIRIEGKGRRMKIFLDNKVILKFKKSPRLGVTRNIPTQAVADFKNQNEKLDGDPVVSVEVCYVLDALGLDISRIGFSCPAGAHGSSWILPLYDEHGDGGIPFMRFEQREDIIIVKSKSLPTELIFDEEDDQIVTVKKASDDEVKKIGNG